MALIFSNLIYPAIILVLVIIAIFIIYAMNGRFDHWKSRFIRRSDRAFQNKRKLKDE